MALMMVWGRMSKYELAMLPSTPSHLRGGESYGFLSITPAKSRISFLQLRLNFAFLNFESLRSPIASRGAQLWKQAL
jgi:hypothetical protein